jgi:cytochrome c-type biogenesis protein CcmE
MENPMTTGRKLAMGGIVIVAATIYMAYVGAADSWQYYLTVDECLDSPEQFRGQRVRVSGKVAANTLRIHDDRTEADFSLTGAQGQLAVRCTGLLPDNLVEGTEVVVEGRFDPSGRLCGDRVLTRCASKYEASASEAVTADVRSNKNEGTR